MNHQGRPFNSIDKPPTSISMAMAEKIIFSKYVREHLLQQGREVERLRHYAACTAARRWVTARSP